MGARSLMGRRMDQTVELLVGKAKRKVNRGQPTKQVGRSRVGLDPSKPGEPPKIVTSELQQSIKARVIKTAKVVRGFIGSNLVYARRQELGFVGVDSLGRRVVHLHRPYLRPTLLENKKMIKRKLTRG
jgi:hypothetical protein